MSPQIAVQSSATPSVFTSLRPTISRSLAAGQLGPHPVDTLFLSLNTHLDIDPVHPRETLSANPNRAQVPPTLYSHRQQSIDGHHLCCQSSTRWASRPIMTPGRSPCILAETLTASLLLVATNKLPPMPADAQAAVAAPLRHSTLRVWSFDRPLERADSPGRRYSVTAHRITTSGSTKATHTSRSEMASRS